MNPRRGSSVTKPSPRSDSSASRTGVTLTPRSSAIRSRRRNSPCLTCPDMMSSRTWAATSSLSWRRLPRARSPEGAPVSAEGATVIVSRAVVTRVDIPGWQIKYMKYPVRPQVRRPAAVFTLSDEERAIVEVVADFVDKEVRPVARDLERAGTYPAHLIDRMKELGVFGLAVPEPYGDVSVSKACYALVTEELARGWMTLAGAFGGHTVVSHLLAVFGTEEQKERYLPRMATGELRATMALTEPSGGSDLQAMTTTA